MLNTSELTQLETVDYTLAQLGAYFAVKIRNDAEAETEIKLYCALNRVRDYFRSVRDKLRVIEENGLDSDE